MLGIIKINSRMYLSKYPIKYLESVFVLTNFEITTLSTLTSQIIIDFFLQKSGNTNISLTILQNQSRFL